MFLSWDEPYVVPAVHLCRYRNLVNHTWVTLRTHIKDRPKPVTDGSESPYPPSKGFRTHSSLGFFHI